jgi:hypothetical protein
VDNKSSLTLSKNPVFHERSKHIQSCLKEGSVNVSHISTEDQLADILTKSVGRVKFHELMDKLVCCVSLGTLGGKLVVLASKFVIS